MSTTIRSLLLAFGLVLPLMTSAQSFNNAYVSRGSFVQFLMNSKGIPSGGSNCFADVKTDSIAASICGARNYGIVSGNPDGKFRPYDAVTFVEAAAMVVRAERVSVASDSVWYRPYIEKLSEWNAIPASLNNILQPLSSVQATELIAKVKNRDGGSSFGSASSSSSSSRSAKDGDLTVSVDDNVVEPGDNVTFTIRIDNDDDDDIETDLNAFLDSDMEFRSASDGGEEIDEDEEIEWQDIEIDEDDSETITLKVRIDSSADDGDTLRVRFETDDDEVSLRLEIQDDDDNDNNDDDDDDDEDADISVSVSESDDPVDEGDTITYRIRLTNNSNDDEETDVTAFLDKDTTFVSATEGGYLRGDDEVQWNDIEVREDRTLTILLTVRVDSSADEGDTLTMEVETDDDDDTEETEVDDDNNDDDDGDEDIDISINASDSSVRVGDTVTFQIRLSNNDNDDIRPIIRAYLDDAMSYLTSGNGGEMVRSDEIKWDDVEIDEDDDRTIQLTVRINDRVRSGDTLVLRVTAGNDERSITIRGE